MVIQGSVRRIVGGFLVALVLAFAILVVKVRSAEAQIYVPSGCKGLTSSDAAWWTRHCYLYPANLHPADVSMLAFVRVR